MSKFFINRPIVAIVISILMVIAGVVALLRLPTAQFPDISDPQIQVTANYTGADANTVAQSVATPIEQQMAGVDGMNYMSSQNASNGQMSLTVDFGIDTVANTDQILAQMRVLQANAQLPSAVINNGVTVQKSTASPLMLIDLSSDNTAFDNIFLANYAYINLNDELTRVPGVASVSIFGAGQYAMRVLGQSRQTCQLGCDHPGDCQRTALAKHGEPGRPDRRRAGTPRPAVHLHGACAGAASLRGRVWRDYRSSE